MCLSLLVWLGPTGGNIGLGFMVNLGATLVLRSKFSARSFFKDAYESQATVTQYIGELCRYLVATPPSEYDRSEFTPRWVLRTACRSDSSQ